MSKDMGLLRFNKAMIGKRETLTVEGR